MKKYLFRLSSLDIGIIIDDYFISVLLITVSINFIHNYSPFILIS